MARCLGVRRALRPLGGVCRRRTGRTVQPGAARRTMSRRPFRQDDPGVIGQDALRSGRMMVLQTFEVGLRWKRTRVPDDALVVVR